MWDNVGYHFIDNIVIIIEQSPVVSIHIRSNAEKFSIMYIHVAKSEHIAT